MAQVTAIISTTFRHRWLGEAFAFLCAVPVDILGLTMSEKMTDRLAGITYRLMGPKVTVEDIPRPMFDLRGIRPGTMAILEAEPKGENMRVRIESDGTGFGTKVLDTDGTPVEGVTGLNFSAQIDDVTRAEIQLSLVRIDAIAEAQFYVKGKQVSAITYADGTVDDFTAA